MGDRPIIFSAGMVKALLSGRKTQTRRLITPGTCTVLGSRVTAKSPAWAGLKFDRAEARTKSPLTGVPRPHLGAPWVHPEDEAAGMEADAIYRVDPIIEVGDRLWVRERGWIAKSKMAFEPFVGNIVDAAPASPDGTPYKVCPSIHMPRWASRLTLAVTDVRVERLQDIGEADAIAEGIEALPSGSPIIGNPYGIRLGDREGFCSGKTAAEAFQALWQVIHGPDAWTANPWVAAISFTVNRENIDALSTSEAAA